MRFQTHIETYHISVRNALRVSFFKSRHYGCVRKDTNKKILNVWIQKLE